MHTDRYQPSANRPASAGASLLVLATVAFGATLVGPRIVPDIFKTPPLVIEQYPVPTPPPEPVDPVRDQKPTPVRTTPKPHQPDSLVKLSSDAGAIDSTPDFTPVTIDPPADPGPSSSGVTIDPPRAPVLVGASVDPRYADSLQPPYPNSEIRNQTEGKLTARVLVGVDGRVKDIEITRSPSKGLADATRRHALAKWRFKPATRDGVPYESWMTMSLNFRLVD
ncbi:TonB family protein [Sphingomonas sp. ST-64]|uniref:TonB family protein n=1 Tax=Sphingomonas plantiphila TaxID=3163295 RepID=A0ABW8YID7_9SPHN